MEEYLLVKYDTLESIERKLTKIEQQLNAGVSHPAPEEWVDNNTFCKILSISKRTAQNYRDQGLITFSQVGNKIFYRRGDVDEFLMEYKRERFA